ncbi:hypothetical protein SEA_SHERA_31 [Streptomyces phage SheRa]|nr:hypothetical protein SEA_SHERA_31 [Streptomyces phage SheRa]
MSKQSILTTAMQNADAAEQETVAAETEETKTFTITFRKKMIKKAVITTVAAAAATYLLSRLADNMSGEPEDETTED